MRTLAFICSLGAAIAAFVSGAARSTYRTDASPLVVLAQGVGPAQRAHHTFVIAALIAVLLLMIAGGLLLVGGVRLLLAPKGDQRAGWYPDPAGGAESRWWNGDRWTEHTR